MQVTQAIHNVVMQINHMLRQMEPAQYRKPLPEFEGNSLGQHFRHILEFFQCLEQSAATGLVDYASRERNLLYEDSPTLTLEAFTSFSRALENLDEHTPVRVRGEFDSDVRPEYQSTYGRELMFVFDHAIHHLAIIKIGLLVHYPEMETVQDLGVSPSTIKARRAKSS